MLVLMTSHAGRPWPLLRERALGDRAEGRRWLPRREILSLGIAVLAAAWSRIRLAHTDTAAICVDTLPGGFIVDVVLVCSAPWLGLAWCLDCGRAPVGFRDVIGGLVMASAFVAVTAVRVGTVVAVMAFGEHNSSCTALQLPPWLLLMLMLLPPLALLRPRLRLRFLAPWTPRLLLMDRVAPGWPRWLQPPRILLF